MTMQAAMVGWAHTRFGRLDDETLESLVLRVTAEALADAGIDAEAVDSIHVGNLGGFDAQAFPAALSTALRASDGARRIYGEGHPVRALLRTTTARLRTMPPPLDAAHPEAEERYWGNVAAREEARGELVGALREVEVAFGDRTATGVGVKGKKSSGSGSGSARD